MRNEIREYTIETGDKRRWYVLHAHSIAHAFDQVRVFEPSCALIILDSQPLGLSNRREPSRATND